MPTLKLSLFKFFNFYLVIICWFNFLCRDFSEIVICFLKNILKGENNLLMSGYTFFRTR